MTSRITLPLLAISAACFVNQAAAAPVESMSLEIFKDGPQRYWEVSVNCEASNQARLMRRPVDDDRWCSSELSTLCNKNKFLLSRQLCNDNYDKLIGGTDSGQNSPVQNQVESIESKVKEDTPISVPIINASSTERPIRPADRESLRKEQMQIEEQRILIEQKRIELRRRELDLQRQQLNAG